MGYDFHLRKQISCAETYCIKNAQQLDVPLKGPCGSFFFSKLEAGKQIEVVINS